MKCKYCEHEIKYRFYNGSLSFNHCHVDRYENDSDNWEVCNILITDCEYCKKEHKCACMYPCPKDTDEVIQMKVTK